MGFIINAARMKQVRIESGNIGLTATLAATPTAEKLYQVLPVSGTANTWGDEVYFYIDVHLPAETDAREEVEPGDLGYWPSGPAFCIFYGPTPASTSDRPKAASPVNVFGHITSDLHVLRNISPGATITVTRA